MIPFMTAHQIRQTFLDFYHHHHHEIIPSAPIIAHDDPTTLFVNSGMMPLKGLFLGQNPQGYKRLCNVQKVLRVSGKHNDLDEVGRDDYHHTFFEMLGHWSFGDYFKKATIRWGWELLTKVYQLPKDHLFVTVHHQDLETRTLWLHETDVHPSHVLNFTDENFWAMGPVGPCGFCSEVHIDKQFAPPGDQTYRSATHGVNSDHGRFIELINFVFMDSTRHEDGSISPLKQKSIDTGAGLERLCSVIQNAPSAYETDLFSPIISKIVQLSGVPYDAGSAGTPHRIIADHLRAVSMGLADGVSFDADGRGYVLRRILRRAQRYSYDLGLDCPCLAELYDSLLTTLGEAYPELQTHSELIKAAITAEETKFAKTLTTSLHRLREQINTCLDAGQDTLPGDVAFQLHDTYGFPMDLTRQVAAEHGLKCDEAGFAQAMKSQQERAKSSHKFHQNHGDWHELKGHGSDSRFCGYTHLSARVKTTRFRRLASEEGVVYEFVFDQTPFYPTSGGQLGDRGSLTNAHGTFEVTSTTKQAERIIHRCQLTSAGGGHFHKLHDVDLIRSFVAQVDVPRREATMRHHSATHLLHSGLRQLLGDHITQRGAYCDHEGLRFDFSHPQALTAAELTAIETWVNTMILAAHPVDITTMDFQTATAEGALHLSTEAYAATVRVLTMGAEVDGASAVSKELCGGTHVQCTAEIGLFVITSDSSIASGTRRITALAGEAARLWYNHQRTELIRTNHLLSTSAAGQAEDKATYADYPTAHKVYHLKQELTELRRAASELQLLKLQALMAELMAAKITTPHGFDLICADISAQLTSGLSNSFLDAWSQHITAHQVVSVLWGVEPTPGEEEDKEEDAPATYNIKFFSAISKALQPQWHAGKLIQHLAPQWQGSGGGRPGRAQGGARTVNLPDQGQHIHAEIMRQLDHPQPPYATKA